MVIFIAILGGSLYFLGEGGRGVSLLRQANDEMNHFEFGSYPCRLDASRKQILHKYNTNSKFEIKKKFPLSCRNLAVNLNKALPSRFDGN